MKSAKWLHIRLAVALVVFCTSTACFILSLANLAATADSQLTSGDITAVMISIFLFIAALAFLVFASGHLGGKDKID